MVASADGLVVVVPPVVVVAPVVVPVVGVDTAAAAALVSNLLLRRLPGPGSAIVETKLHYDGAIAVGDRFANAQYLFKRPVDVCFFFDQISQHDALALQ